MKVRFTKSARKHRIGKAHALYVIRNFEAIYYTKIEKEYALWEANDNRDLGLEILALVEGDALIVIHVMPINFRRGSRKWEK